MTEGNMRSIVFIGGGNMASCIVGGMIYEGFQQQEILVSVPSDESKARLTEAYGVSVVSDNLAAVAEADVVILAVKPQIMRNVVLDLAAALPKDAVVVSVAAGISINSIQSWLGEDRAIVRAMPNTPSLVRTGATGLFANDHTDEQQRRVVAEIFEAVGVCCWVKSEELINAVIAVSGSGPAYFFQILHIMQSVGQELGLSEDDARQLASQTALGAAKMAIASEKKPAESRRQVTSPGGTTERALNTFQQEGLESTFRRAMNNALARAEEMSKDFSE